MCQPARLARVVVPLAVGALIATATATATAAGAGTASGAPVPAPKAFGPVADAFPRWEQESGCSPTEKPGALALRRLLARTYGPIPSNTVRACTAADSGHEEGRAVDWMTSVRVPAQKAMAHAFVGWLRATDGYGNTYAMARRLGVEYVIWNNRMWRLYDTARGWTEYGGCLAPARSGPAYDTTCHRNHVHVSLSWDGAYQRTSYASGYVACPLVPTPGAAPALPQSGLDFVAVRPARLLSTTKGSGTPTGPCRVRGGARLDLPVLGRGGVPATGVAAVVLRVAIGPGDSASRLRVWPTGAAPPPDPVAAARPGQAAALVTVPLGAGGRVSLAHSAGMSHLSADVVGYYRAAGIVGDRFHPTRGRRMVSGVTVGAGKALGLDLGAVSGVARASGGLLTVTVRGAGAAGGLRLHAAGDPVPGMSALRFAAGDVVTGSVLARADGSGHTTLVNASATPVTVSVDLQGVYAPAGVPGGLQYLPLPPARLVRTATDVGITGPLTAGRVASFPVTGRRGVPATGAAAVLLSAMASASADTSLAVWTDGRALPGTRPLRPRAGRPAADALAVVPSAAGLVAARSTAGTTQLVVDVAGYFRAPPG